MEQIGERVEAERRLARSETMLRSVFESSPIPKATMTADGRVLAANAAMLALMGVATAAQLSWARLFGGAGPADTAALRRLLTGLEGTVECQCSVRRGDDSRAVVRAVATVVEGPDDTAQMIVQMVDITEREAALANAVARSERDSLTGLSNRQHFGERLRAALADRRRDRRHVAVFMIDLDHFKEINDGLGHAAGDDVLIEVARRIKGLCRHADTAGRIGGDEFWVIVADMDDELEAIRFAAAVLRAMSAPFLAAGASVHVGASIGFAIAPGDGTEVDEVMRKADSAQYRAKQLKSGWAVTSTATGWTGSSWPGT